MERNKTEQAAKWPGIEKLAEQINDAAELDTFEKLSERLRRALEPLLEAAENALEITTEFRADFDLKEALRKEIESWRK